MTSGQTSEEEARRLAAELGKTLKEGERILGPTRRPDGTLRKPIRIRAGYVPQEEVAIYQSKGALWRKEMEAQVGPPGYDQAIDAKPKSKSVKRNERKKEKRLQAALEKAKNAGQMENEGIEQEEQNANGMEELNADGMEEQNDGGLSQRLESTESIASQMCQLSLSGNITITTSGLDAAKGSNPDNPMLDIDKKIRALKKKIRLTEAQQQKTSPQDMKPELAEKVGKLEGWQKDLKLLEDRRAELLTAS
ncbi:hypothetical protein Nepgr_023834 [Nepenthes gracilis]|uniref:WIBG Mago-binding domain-containing protein n=1 Tax=Nepenthes gracilis TaxID=150966 RepID=A0AAD3XZU8_NEPGR|nr:hypothetical protein Nepgr_023834 [Nepenthes gracilis]